MKLYHKRLQTSFNTSCAFTIRIGIATSKTMARPSFFHDSKRSLIGLSNDVSFRIRFFLKGSLILGCRWSCRLPTCWTFTWRNPTFPKSSTYGFYQKNRCFTKQRIDSFLDDTKWRLFRKYRWVKILVQIFTNRWRLQKASRICFLSQLLRPKARIDSTNPLECSLFLGTMYVVVNLTPVRPYSNSAESFLASIELTDSCYVVLG